MSFFHRVLEWAGIECADKTMATADVTIKKGDTLSEIAHGMTGKAEDWHKIADLNPGIDPDAIQAGQVIKIPLEWVH